MNANSQWCAFLAAFVVFSSSPLRADFTAGDPVSFRRDTFVYNLVGTPTIKTGATTSELATVTEVFTYRRDPMTYADPVKNPTVTWVSVILERVPPISGSFPLEDGTPNGIPIILSAPTGSFPAPTLQPNPTSIHPGDHVMVSITPTISHRITFNFATYLRRTGTTDAWIGVGGSQNPSYDPGKIYNREIGVPDPLTSNLNSPVALDLRTVISYGGVEVAAQEQTGAIVVEPAEPFALIEPHFQAGGEFVATLTGAKAGTVYWIETSVNLNSWERKSSFVASSSRQTIGLPSPIGARGFYRIGTDIEP